jgi:hypothetical protein
MKTLASALGPGLSLSREREPGQGEEPLSGWNFSMNMRKANCTASAASSGLAAFLVAIRSR